MVYVEADADAMQPCCQAAALRAGNSVLSAMCQERRRAKDPEYFDQVHGSNPAQTREATVQEAEDNAHAQRRKEGEDLFTADAERRKERENA